ncbi:tetratricopeptide repeat protein [Nocardia sp. CA-084685]|uniref:tetratricopeptide repeat protein n=1 Tax=Nocardia sp. CA-084685 TaxID=3239970 RepID=UPI003D98A88D
MGGRLALVVGSECEGLGRSGYLGFVDELATGLFERLRDLGGWISAVGDGPIVNPTIDGLKAAVGQACSAASQQNATLLISFLGHGVTVHKSLYLLATDSDPARVDSDTAYNLGQGIIEKLIPARLDGLIVLVDTCQAGTGVTDAYRWVEVIDPTAGRIEVLAASDDGIAYDGCFTRTMLSLFDQGLPEQGTYLLPGDLRPQIGNTCERQVPRQFSSAVGGDPGLWLVPNISRVNDAAFGRPSAGFVDLLTRGPAIGASVQDCAEQVYAAGEHRLRMVVGPAGCGKSTVMALLIRPILLSEAPFSGRYITAAVFVDVSSTLESFTAELIAQLRRVDGYSAAVEAVAAGYRDCEVVPDGVELNVLGPLELIRPRFGQLIVIVDGLDQAETGVRKQITTTIAELTTRKTLTHVRVIVGVREGHGIEDTPQLAHRRLIDMSAPTDADIITAVLHAHNRADDQEIASWQVGVASLRAQTSAGGWLLARLILETPHRTRHDRIDLDTLVRQRIHAAITASGLATTRSVVAILGILAAAGSGPVLPIELLDSALHALGIHTDRSHIRDAVANLGVLISRGNPGTPIETLGLAHTDFQPAIQQQLTQHEFQVVDTHHALLAAIESTHTTASSNYARGSAIRHFLTIGEPSAALQFLLDLDTARVAENRDRWSSWLPQFTGTLSPDHRDVLNARGNLAYWRAEAGDIATAVTEFERLLIDQVRVLGADHPHTLNTRHILARCRAVAGDIATAVTEFELLLIDQVRALGADHPHTLNTRGNLARCRAEVGDIATAVTEFERVLIDQVRVLGADHRDTLIARNNLVYWVAEAGDIATAVTEFERLLTDRVQALGPDHVDTFHTRNILAFWRARAGDIATAVTEFERVLSDQVRVLGADHPDVLNARADLAYWRAKAGNSATAVTEFERVLADQVRVLGADHPDVLNARGHLARCRAEAGDIATAVIEFERVLADQVRVLGADHPYTLDTQRNLAYWPEKLQKKSE